MVPQTNIQADGCATWEG